ncbi:hypothetical protein OBBRIDRAFT_456018 [Obba rivulosa]|uniref:Uncharacterized protein n=1 Tax=Obba rivulosa TaxID=1052685 RepID=A0A8E2DP02_9APHY|nr:hypothetical protein OBBRIDRAFT_456018 [Obba rivulosa]
MTIQRSEGLDRSGQDEWYAHAGPSRRRTQSARDARGLAVGTTEVRAVQHGPNGIQTNVNGHRGAQEPTSDVARLLQMIDDNTERQRLAREHARRIPAADRLVDDDSVPRRPHPVPAALPTSVVLPPTQEAHPPSPTPYVNGTIPSGHHATTFGLQAPSSSSPAADPLRAHQPNEPSAADHSRPIHVRSEGSTITRTRLHFVAAAPTCQHSPSVQRGGCSGRTPP